MDCLTSIPYWQGVSVRGIEIKMISDLEEFLKNNSVQIAALTLPKNKAAEMADLLVANNIKAIWNFATWISLYRKM